MTSKTSCNVQIYNLLYLLLAFKIFVTTAQMVPISVKVGMVVTLDKNGESIGLNCINMSLAEFYATNSHYRTRLTLITRDSKGDAILAAAAVVDLLKNDKVQAIIGPEYSSEASFIISLGKKAHVPIITYSATSPALSSFRSPYFVRATLNDSSQVEAIGAIVKAYGWQEVVLVYEDNLFGEGIVPFLSSALENVNARVTYRSVLPSQATDDQIRAELYKLQSMHTRVFIVHVLVDIGSRLFTKAKELGMMSENYVWIITDGMTYELNTLAPLVIKSMFGVVGVRPYIPKTDELDGFKIRYKMRVQENNPKTLSPEVNTYGLWAYDVAIALAMAVENASFGSNLTFLEANISSNSNDIESIGTSVVGPKLIQVLLSTSFKGLSGIFSFVDGQLQSPPYEIINVVGPGDQVIGYWTKKNGIIRELNSVGAETNEYSTDKSNFGSTIWPGDKTSPGKGWVIPTDEKKLRIGIPIKEGFSEFVKVIWNPDNSITAGGFCIKVFDEVMKLLPYGVPYEYIPFATPDRKMAGTYDDLVHQVYLGNFDAVAGDVTILANRSNDVDFTLPYMETGITVVIPIKADTRKNGLIFLEPLTWQLWVTILGSFIGMGMLIWLMEHPENDDFKGEFLKQVGMVFWFAFSTMVFAHREKVVRTRTKLLLIFWFFVVLILSQSYTSSLTSMLTITRQPPTVVDVDMLVLTKSYVGFKNGSFVHQFLKKLKFDENRLVAFNSPEEMDELFTKGSISAAFHEIPYLKLFLAKYCSKYTMVDPRYNADGFGFVFPRGSPLVPDVSRAILNFTEGKTMTEMEESWLLYKTQCSSPEDTGKYSLELASFMVLFAIMGGVAAAALLYCVVEFFWKEWGTPNGNDDTFTKFKNIVKKLKLDTKVPKREFEILSEKLAAETTRLSAETRSLSTQLAAETTRLSAETISLSNKLDSIERKRDEESKNLNDILQQLCSSLHNRDNQDPL